MEQERYPHEGPGLYGCDRDLFARVWQRVMPVEREDCPIQLVPPPEEGPRQQSKPAQETRKTPQTQAAQQAEQPTGVPQVSLPDTQQTPSAEDGITLQQLLQLERKDYLTVRALARHSRGREASVLSAIARDDRRHVKRLTAAYFLFSGIMLEKRETVALPQAAPRGALRRQLLEKHSREHTYRRAAEVTPHPWLQEIYLELAAEEGRHTNQLFTLMSGQ